MTKIEASSIQRIASIQRIEKRLDNIERNLDDMYKLITAKQPGTIVGRSPMDVVGRDLRKDVQRLQPKSLNIC